MAFRKNRPCGRGSGRALCLPQIVDRRGRDRLTGGFAILGVNCLAARPAYPCWRLTCRVVYAGRRPGVRPWIGDFAAVDVPTAFHKLCKHFSGPGTVRVEVLEVEDRRDYAAR